MDVFSNLGLLQKPDPGTEKEVIVEAPVGKEQEKVDIKIKIVDKTAQAIDRTTLLININKVMVSNLSDVRVAKSEANPSGPSYPNAHISKNIADNYVENITRKDLFDDVLSNKLVKSETGIVKSIKKRKGRIKIGHQIKREQVESVEEKEPSPQKSKKGSIERTGSKSLMRTLSQVPFSKIKIGDILLSDRLWPGDDGITIRAPEYYMNNRKIFINFIDTLFRKHKDDLEEESKALSCDRGPGAFSLMTHQSIVRDYINLYSPYRGLLIYHGLGAGKTCSSISIAEGMKNDMEVIIMTPASLKQNYITELKTCGDTLYRLNQFWEFVSVNTEDDLEEKLNGILHLPVGFITKQKGVWIINIKKEPNYDTLTTPEKMSLNVQLDNMIRAKYKFISYNGIRMSHLNDLVGDDANRNPFDNKVIIIDEAHNFVSRIVNKMNKPGSVSFKLYKYIMSATNCRVVFLTGTPIINYPNEIGIMYNMLRGYIKTFTFYVNIKSSDRITQETIGGLLSQIEECDYIKYNTSAKTISVTRNPFGFVSSRTKSGYLGVKTLKDANDRDNKCSPRKNNCKRGFFCNLDEQCVPLSDELFAQSCITMLKKHDIDVVQQRDNSYYIETKYKALPDTLKGFNDMFINPKTGSMKNMELFQKRVLGLTSYFRSAQEQLMPIFDLESDFKVLEIPMSDYQFGLYSEARTAERKVEKRNATRKKSNKDGDEESTSTYRIFSRAFCNFVFPRELKRPMPKDTDDLKDAIMQENIDEDDLDGLEPKERMENVDGRYDTDDEAELVELEKEKTDATYADRKESALIHLAENAGKYLTPEALKTYSPKFLDILKKVSDEENVGKHLIYSQFRTLEGIGIISLILENNGFARFKIKKNDQNEWSVDIAEEDVGKPTFVLYTGTESTEAKEIIRNVYNGDWDKIPTNMRDHVNTLAENNNMGEIIKVFMITSSGAEGISLKSTRFVHIVEPYWHPVRVEQVIGRARRICSHNELPEEYRDVKVFLYLMTFVGRQLIKEELDGLASHDLLLKDVSKIDGKTPITSDEKLWEVSTKKQEINRQILDALKSSSMDCSLHSKSTDNDPIICFPGGEPTVDEFITTPDLQTGATDRMRKINKKVKKVRYESITLDGRKYAFRRINESLIGTDTKSEGVIYDLESYHVAKKNKGLAPRVVGYLRYNEVSKTFEIKDR
tara:strand:+ start:992 stop:4555 length:3564 start_codon:yes stop_codon:yes gene_type:complete